MLKAGKLYKVLKDFHTEDQKCPQLKYNEIVMFIDSFENKVKYSLETVQDLKAFHGIDMETEILDRSFRFLYHNIMITVLVNRYRDLLNEGYLTPI